MPAIPRISLPSLPGAMETAAMGLLGADWIDDTSDYTGGVWTSIMALTDTTFTVLETGTVALNGTASGNLNGKSVARGTILYGWFTRIQLGTGGIVMAYRGKMV